VLTEQVFTIPGFGKLIIDAVFNRDYLVVQGVVLVTATTYVLLNLLADLAYFAVNPRLRHCRWRRCSNPAACRAKRRPRRCPPAPGAARCAACAAGAARCSAWRWCCCSW
jgi:hypothetical protein